MKDLKSCSLILKPCFLVFIFRIVSLAYFLRSLKLCSSGSYLPLFVSSYFWVCLLPDIRFTVYLIAFSILWESMKFENFEVSELLISFMLFVMLSRSDFYLS